MTTAQMTALEAMKQGTGLGARWRRLDWSGRAYRVLGALTGIALTASIVASMFRSESTRLVWWLDRLGPTLALAVLLSTVYAVVELIAHTSKQPGPAVRKLGYATGHALLYGCAALLGAFFVAAAHGDLLGEEHRGAWESPKGEHTAHVYDGWFDLQSIYVTRDSSLVVHKLGIVSAHAVRQVQWIDEEHFAIVDDEGESHYYDVAGGSDQDGAAPAMSAAEMLDAISAAELARVAADDDF
jgi:hypothetical protein